MPDSIPLSALEASPAAKFENIGDKYEGRIVTMDERQQTNPKGELQTFSDGSPKMLWVITLETANGDKVALWAKAGKFKAETGSGESMLGAIGTAVRAAGAEAVDVGGQLAIAYTGRGEKRPGYDAPKLYQAKYAPPAASVAVDDLFSK